MELSTFGTVQPAGALPLATYSQGFAGFSQRRYERVTSVVCLWPSKLEKEMTLSAAQAQSRRFSPEQSAAVMTELTAILASDLFSSSKRCRSEERRVGKECRS